MVFNIAQSSVRFIVQMVLFKYQFVHTAQNIDMTSLRNQGRVYR